MAFKLRIHAIILGTSVFMLCFSANLLAQDYDAIYGEDLNLVNGKKFVNYYGTAVGHPFLEGQEFVPGSAQIKGKQYNGLTLNYDIHRHEVIVDFNSEIIGMQRYIIPWEFLERFSMGSRSFIKMQVGDEDLRIYELLSEGPYYLVFTHDKDYSISKDVNIRGYLFSEDRVKMYRIVENELVAVKNNRTFRNSFPEEMRPGIKAYMKQRRMRIKQTGIMNLKRMMQHINQL